MIGSGLFDCLGIAGKGRWKLRLAAPEMPEFLPVGWLVRFIFVQSGEVIRDERQWLEGKLDIFGQIIDVALRLAKVVSRKGAALGKGCLDLW